MTDPEYIGRFAPSPTGSLHFGSLVAAVASFIDAKAHQGKWLLRIDDIDPPREVAGATDAILHSLEIHSLLHDGEILYQHKRQSDYQFVLKRLTDSKLVYPCTCSRQDLLANNGIYNRHCLRHPAQTDTPHAYRIKTKRENSNLNQLAAKDNIIFNDLFYGLQEQSISTEVGDFILKRKDGLFAYQLAVVLDDIYQGITHVIRGSDLLSSTPRQIFLFQVVQATPPEYGHIPLVKNNLGQKLSKQNKAEPINDLTPSRNLHRALNFLRQNPPKQLQYESPENILRWASANWNREKLANQTDQ